MHAVCFSTSVSCWARLFLQHSRCRSLWIIRKTDDRWILLLHVKFFWLFDGSSWLSNSDSTVSTFSSQCALHLPLPGRLSTVPNYTSSLLMLFFAQALLRNCYKLPSIVARVKVVVFAWYNIKIRVIFGVQFERRKVDKNANLHENWNKQTLF